MGSTLTPYRSLSLWHDTAGEDWTPRPSLPGSTSCDVVIVGAGFTGLWTAYYLRKVDPGLRVVVLEAEVAGFGASGRNGGWCSALFATDWDRLVEERDDVVFFDGRNRFEAEIGRFRGAIVPDVETTRDFVELLDSGAYDHLKDTPIVTYCTGGVRCEVLSSLMRKRGFGEVYQLEGGIVRYGESFGNAGLWEGSLYVFDERQTMTFGADASVLGACTACGAPTGGMGNCRLASCRKQVPTCDACEPACAAHALAA